MWVLYPVIPPLRRQRQLDLCEFKVNLVYIGSSKAACSDSSISNKTKDTRVCLREKFFAFHCFREVSLCVCQKARIQKREMEADTEMKPSP